MKKFQVLLTGILVTIGLGRLILMKIDSHSFMTKMRCFAIYGSIVFSSETKNDQIKLTNNSNSNNHSAGIIINFQESGTEELINQKIDDFKRCTNLKLSTIESQPNINTNTDHVYLINDSNITKYKKNRWLMNNAEFVSPNLIYKQASLELPNNIEINLPWNLRENLGLNLRKIWGVTQGEDVVVAVIDSGIIFGASLDKNKFVPGYDFTASDRGIPITKAEDSVDDNGHGSHIAAIIAQDTHKHLGISGIAFKTKLMPLRVTRSREVTSLVLERAIKYAVDNGADIINLSLEQDIYDPYVEKAIVYAYEKNVVVIAAAGNSGKNTASYPANYGDKVLGIGAYTSSGEIAPYSNYGTGVDTYAPGGLITGVVIEGCTTSPLDHNGIVQIITKYRSKTEKKEYLLACHGTSQAAAHVTGVAALLVSILKPMGINNPKLVFNIIEDSDKTSDSTIKKESKIEQLDASIAGQQALFKKGQKFEKQGKNQKALAVFIDALKLNIIKDTDKPLYQSIFINQYKLAIQKKAKEALDIYTKAQKEYKLEISAKVWNDLCWRGNFYDQAKDTIYACEQAINISKQDENLKDTRGIARALTGDINGAIQDFEDFIDWNNREQFCTEELELERKFWIQQLKLGKMPFTNALINDLRSRGKDHKKTCNFTKKLSVD